MSLSASFRIAVRAIRGNPLRSLLTMLGVIIGVASVIAMVSIGQGARQATTQQIQALGSNLLTVMASFAQQGGVAATGQVQTLTLDDADAIARDVPGVTGVSAEISRQAQVVFGNQNTYTQVQGVTPAFPEVRNFRPAQGEFFTDDDVRRRSKVALLGKTVATTLFSESDPIGQRIRIRGVTFTVIGVMESKGASPFGDRDDAVYVPVTTAQYRLFGVTNVRAIQVQARTADDMPAVQQAATDLLRTRHRIPSGRDNDFTIRSQADILQAFAGVTRTMTLLLGGVAAVALIVGGIGIMNIMLVSVTERTREIGIRKAVGARRADILLQFLVESVTVGVTGGLIGIAFGILGSKLITQLAGWATLISTQAIVLAFSFAVAVGVFFGLYPARRAAMLDPIEALRHQ
ncbi:MAG: ABC transporter permease [bacterium]|nr:ABC transporter permease [bacterium]